MDFGNTVALSRVFLKSLQPDMNNVFIVGIIIAKQRPRKFLDTKGNGYKGVWNFTLRDSPRDYINVTIWAKHEDIIHISSTFNIGKVVELINPRIAVRNVNDYGEQFKPMVTSPFSLALNEPTQIVEHAVVNRNYYCNLLNLPTKPIAGLIPLNQVQNNGRNLNNVYIDVLGVLRGCGTPRTINTATGETFQVLHVEIFDVTAFSLSISLWDSDNILRASTWTPRYTVLFFTDVKLEWSDFEKAFRAKCTNRTVVTENPPCRETEFLLNYAKDAPIETFDIVDKMLTTLPEANQIQEIMSVNQIQNRVDSILQGITVDKQFSALVYAYITNMDLDGINKSTFAKW